MTEWSRHQPRVLYSREKILAEAEAGARAEHARLKHRGEDWVQLDGKEVGLRLEDRIRRAKDYAVWRIGAYERGECDTPY